MEIRENSMRKKLAIKSHVSRGKEIIELFKMMGGWECGYCGCGTGFYYYISQFGNIEASCKPSEFDTYIVYTLEEFLEKFPYKVGDIVKTGKDEEGVIKQMRWVNNDIVYWVNLHKTCDWTQTLSVDVLDKYNRLNLNDVETKVEYPGRNREDILFDSIIWHLRNSVNNGKQYLSGGDCETYFRELVKKVNENDMESCKCPEYEDIKKVAYLSINEKDYADEIEVNLGDDYEYKFEMNRLYILKKKPKYPTIYEECCKIKHCDTDFYVDTHLYSNTLGLLYKLLICRDAYWKIAGKELGLGKPWKPNFGKCVLFDIKFYLYQDDFVLHKGEYNCSDNCILVFPTAEMRDAFFKNFKDLIEKCKELL